MEDDPTSDSLNEEMRICTPSHPLPLEIQQMEQEETTCRYCGVSYLIMHEFQRLQERLREVERQLERERGSVGRERECREQLKRERGSVERERECREQLQCSQVQLEELRQANQIYLHRLKALTLQVSHESGDQLETGAALESEREQSLRLRTVCERQRVLLHDVGPVLRHAAAELCGVKQELSLLSDHWSTNTALILQHCITARSDHVVLQQKASRAEEEAAKLQQDVKELQELLHTSQMETQTLEHCMQKQHVLNQEVRSLQDELQKSHGEKEHVERLLESTKKEGEESRLRLQQQCDEQSATILSLSGDLRGKEASWSSCRRRCESLQQQLLTWKQKEVETRRELEGAMKEGQEIKGDREALSEEMRRMEDAFRAKLQLADEEKLKWRRDAALELNIERQKNEQQIQKYHTEYQQLQDTLATSVQAATQDLKEEGSALKALLRECEEELRSVRDEASRREDQILREHQAEVEQLQRRLQTQEAEELQQAHGDIQQLKKENCTLHDEVRLLQETVRRECEERAELTAALSLAKEQLLGVRQTLPISSAPRSPASSSLPSLSAGHARDSKPRSRSRNSTSWNGNPRQPLPSLPRITTERPAPLTERPAPLTETRRRKDKR